MDNLNIDNLEEEIKSIEEMVKPTEEYEREREHIKQLKEEYQLKMKKLKLRVGIVCFIAGGLFGPKFANIVDSFRKGITINHEYNKMKEIVSTLEVETKIHGGYKIDNEYVYNFEKHGYNCNLEGDGSVSERITMYCEKYNLSDAISDMAKEKFHHYYNDNFEEGDEIDLVNQFNNEYEMEHENNNGLGK